ncbi:MAG: hypothetical protein ABW137_00945 [Mycobacterium sp.]
MSTVLAYNSLLDHLVRTDSWLAQGQSSYALARRAVDSADFASAEDYAAMTVQEASEAYELYATWLRQIPNVLVDNGISADVLEQSLAETTARIGDHDLDTGWATYQHLIKTFTQACQDNDADAARNLLAEARRTWQHHHDRACDSIVALLGLAATQLGEGFVGELWDILLARLYDRAATVYDPATRTWAQSLERLFLDIAEATRGHLTGPRRDGSFSVTEDADRWVMTFAPCGSGGRTYEVEPTDVSPRVTTERHDWAWNTPGVCLYCAHCCQLQQRAPIARLGFPLRVVKPPTQGQSPAVCTWSIYKDPSRVPDEAYTSVGFDPPTRHTDG